MTTDTNKQAAQIHSCSLYCDRPECIKAQRDELRDRMAAPQGEAVAEPAYFLAVLAKWQRPQQLQDTMHVVGCRNLAAAQGFAASQEMEGWNYTIVPLFTATQPAAGVGPDEAILKERDDAEDFIDALLDEVLGSDRAEWSSSYGRADALADVRERMYALHAPMVETAWDRFEKAAQPEPQGEAVAPEWNAASEAMLWLNEIEKYQGGANGPTIKLRSAILAMAAHSKPIGKVESAFNGAAGFHVCLAAGEAMPKVGVPLYTSPQPAAAWGGDPSTQDYASTQPAAGVEGVKRGIAAELQPIESKLRNLHGVAIVDGERRITLDGLRVSMAEANPLGDPWSSWRDIPCGGKAVCSCCANSVARVFQWNTLQICNSCYEVARNPAWKATQPEPQGELAELIETLHETIVQWDEGGGKRSRRELARRILAVLRGNK